jgi:hypothetical protein
MNLRTALEPMLHVDPAHWRGLPEASVEDFDALLGPPEERTEGTLGYYPATRCRYRDKDGAGIILWARNDAAVMVEAMEAPPPSVLDDLPEPTIVLPQEILIPDAYAHEYLYCATGLVLTVAESLHGGADRIVRCRGVRPLTSARDFGPAYYMPFEDQIAWSESDSAGDPGELFEGTGIMNSLLTDIGTRNF